MKKIIKCFFILQFLTFFLINICAEIKYKKIIFVGSCFWCMQPPLEKLNGIIEVSPGYVNSLDGNLTNKDSSKNVHIEAIEITYDPSKITYTDLLDVFWSQINLPEGQFADRAQSYQNEILYSDEEQKQLVEKLKEELAKSGKFQKPIVTDIIEPTKFYKTEKKLMSANLTKINKSKNTMIYKKYTREELKKKLTSIQYEVTQEGGTEPAYQNEYWDNKKEGIYVDIVSGEVLFSSTDKYDSKTGWPSFTKPIEQKNIIEKIDKSLFASRIGVRSAYAHSHLGHVFNDGPKPTGLRYCINSAALQFIPKENFEKEGYAGYKILFEKKIKPKQ